jgi:hypothetical protein
MGDSLTGHLHRQHVYKDCPLDSDGKPHNGRSLVDVRHVLLVAPLKTGYDILAGVMRITSELLQLSDSEKDSKSEGL